MAMFQDMDSFDEVFRAWAKIEKEWKPKQIEGYEQEESPNECKEEAHCV